MHKPRDKPPLFSSELGILYPLVWRILSSNRFWSPSMWLPRESGIAVDIYLCAWWLIELLIAIVCGMLLSWRGCAVWLCGGLLLFRLFDMGFVLLSILLKGFYRRSGDWLSGNRIVLLVLANTLEIMFVYGLLYRACGVVAPEAAAMEPPLRSLLDSCYFSVVTATTLGYGNPHPVGWLSRILSIMETLTVFLVVVALVGYVAGARRTPKDREHDKDPIEKETTNLPNKSAGGDA